MTRKHRLRRVALLCCHCLRNLAYYRAGWRNRKPVFSDEFWKTANGNFLDACVLEWCKLFGDARGLHYWGKVITDSEIFFAGLLKELPVTESELDTYVKEMRTYRDKFVAHLDSDLVMNIPRLDLATTSVLYLYKYILANEDDGNFFYGLPSKGAGYFRASIREAKRQY
jgi:hypothetical protein